MEYSLEFKVDAILRSLIKHIHGMFTYLSAYEVQNN